ncbi:hypothetical protein TcCL_NonESM09753 [Trypanosoma cruzi]|nr:hypothetical protein TcCL_NonESM09753 [Trypanosoma cruzi]
MWSPKIVLRRLGLDPPSPSRESALGKRGCWHAPKSLMRASRSRSFAWGWAGLSINGVRARQAPILVAQEDRPPPQCWMRAPRSGYSLPPLDVEAARSDYQRL